MAGSAPTSASPAPSDRHCRRILEEYRVPPHIRRHSEVVARVATLLATQLAPLQGGRPDPDTVRAAGLLHDLSKMPCLENETDHALEAGRELRRLGLPEIAEMVSRHVRLGKWDPRGPVTGAEILNYSDKRVRHEEIVSLEERFEDLQVRYGRGRPEVERRIQADQEVITRVEDKIFARLPFGPAQVEALVETGET